MDITKRQNIVTLHLDAMPTLPQPISAPKFAKLNPLILAKTVQLCKREKLAGSALLTGFSWIVNGRGMILSVINPRCRSVAFGA